MPKPTYEELEQKIREIESEDALKVSERKKKKPTIFCSWSWTQSWTQYLYVFFGKIAV